MQSLKEINRSEEIRRGRVLISIFISVASVILLICFLINKHHSELVPTDLIEPNMYPEFIDNQTL